MSLRLVISMLLALHAFVAWGASPNGQQPTDAIAQVQPMDSCGSSCCCPPKACPCAAAPAPREQTPVEPVLPTRPDRQDGQKIAPHTGPIAVAGTAEDGAAGSPATIDAWAISSWMPGRRVQQLKCVWLM